MATPPAATRPDPDPAPAPAQGSLFAAGPIEVRPDRSFERIDLGGEAWVDVARDWLGGADELCARLIAAVDWQHHRRWMYDRMVDEPRLSRWYRASDPLPDEALAWFRVAVGRHYGVGFGAMGLNYYRDGRRQRGPPRRPRAAPPGRHPGRHPDPGRGPAVPAAPPGRRPGHRPPSRVRATCW